MSENDVVFGLKPACFAALVSLLERVKPLREVADADPKKPRKLKAVSNNTVKQLLADANAFEPEHEITVAQAANIALMNGWPQHTDSQIQDLYRKSEVRQQQAPPIGLTHFPDLSPERQDVQRKQGYRLDHELRQGLPEGPEYRRSLDELAEDYADRLRQLAVDHGIAAYTKPDFFASRRGMTLAELASRIAKTGRTRDASGKLLPMPEHVLVDLLAADQFFVVREDELATLREIYVRVSLDCPSDQRDHAIERIVAEWKHRREEAGLSIAVRDTLAAKREDMRRLAKRLRALRGTQGFRNRKQTTVAAGTDAANWDRFVERLHKYLGEEGHEMDLKDLSELAEAAKQDMTRSEDPE